MNHFLQALQGSNSNKKKNTGQGQFLGVAMVAIIPPGLSNPVWYTMEVHIHGVNSLKTQTDTIITTGALGDVVEMNMVMAVGLITVVVLVVV